MPNHRDIQIEPSTSFGKIFSERGVAFEDKYLALVENAPVIIFVVDLDGNFLYINRTAQKITGYSLSELLQKNLLTLVAKDSKDSVRKVFQNLHEINHFPLWEVEVVSLNGNRIPLDIHFKPLKDNKGLVFALDLIFCIANSLSFLVPGES